MSQVPGDINDIHIQVIQQSCAGMPQPVERNGGQLCQTFRSRLPGMQCHPSVVPLQMPDKMLIGSGFPH